MQMLNSNRQPCSYFLFLAKVVLLKVVHPLKIYQHVKLHGPILTGESFALPQKFERPPLCNGPSYGIKSYGVDVNLNGMTSVLKFIKIYQLVQKLIREQTHTHADTHGQTQTGSCLIILLLSFRRKVG
jgi:hypothetical protein